MREAPELPTGRRTPVKFGNAFGSIWLTGTAKAEGEEEVISVSRVLLIPTVSACWEIAQNSSAIADPFPGSRLYGRPLRSNASRS
ncbi:MAG: hypothetical protein Ct9H300mP1_25220 [Planctomycetaceae bacterium]|nr:MAG: hypothetical protein Ct9H300mP1_25220 [Planctomycetaceae bacterium]